MDFYDVEAKDAVRFVWNAMPGTKIQAVKSSIPQAVHYTPFVSSEIPLIEYIPLKCSCEAYVNPFTLIDYNRKLYTCQFCGASNQLPPNYANQISPTRLPKQLSQGYSTYEFKAQNKPQPNGYLFVIDLCLSQQELDAVKKEITEIIESLPEDCYVGLITFHKHINIYELPARLNTVYCLNGAKEYQPQQIHDVLGLQIKNDPRGICQDVTKKYIVPLATVKQNLIYRIKNIGVDPTIYINQRPKRAFGAALSAAITLIQCSAIIPRVITFLGGPTTIGLGTVIQRSYKSTLRTQDDINKNTNLQFYAKASKQYESLAKRCLAKRIVVDLFAFTLEQFGLLQMRKLIEMCGGFLVMQQQFRGSVFKDTLKKIFIQDSQLPFCVGVDAQIKAYASKQILVNGMLGQCYSLHKKSNGIQLAETEIGESGTNSWYIGSLDNNKTVSLLYESLAKDKTGARVYYIQFQTHFRYKGQIKCRVTTVRRSFAQSVQQLSQGFDQQAAVILLARLAVYKCIVQEQKNISSWIDKILFKFTAHYANYTRGDIHSFSLPPQMKQFPQFIYHLRRSQLVSTFGVSPDECYYHRHHLLRQTVGNSISMIQPALLAYTVQDPTPQPVMLDQQSMGDQVILLLDCYFVVMIWQGPTVKDWEDKGYHQTQQYQYLNAFFNAPNEDIDYIMRSRFPSPVFYKTYPYHSKQRYLKSRVNPKKTGDQNENMLTDDANINAFTEYLIKLVVNQQVN